MLSLNQNQRISFQLIHGIVEQVNFGNDELKKLTADIQNSHSENGMTEKLVKVCIVWGDKIKAEYASCASLQWQIKYHLDNQGAPDLSPFTKAHESYLAYLDQVNEDADKFIESGKKIERAKFEKNYDPDDFKHV